MTVTAIELLIALLGGEAPEGLKEVKEAYAKDLAISYLHDEKGMELAEIAELSLDDLAALVEKHQEPASLPNQTKDLTNGGDQQTAEEFGEVELSHAVTVLHDGKTHYLKTGKQSLPLSVIAELVKDGIIKDNA